MKTGGERRTPFRKQKLLRKSIRSIKDHWEEGICIFFSIVFIISSATKIWELQEFSTTVGIYSSAYISSLVAEHRLPLSIILVLTECILSIGLLIKGTRWYALRGILALLSFFVYLTARDYLWPIDDMPIGDCGCFGRFLTLSPLLSFIKSISLWIICLLALSFHAHQVR